MFPSFQKGRIQHAQTRLATPYPSAACWIVGSRSGADLYCSGLHDLHASRVGAYQTAIEASSGHQLTVVPNKSSLGLLALFEKRADFAMISAPSKMRSINWNCNGQNCPMVDCEISPLRPHAWHLPSIRMTPFAILPKSKCAPSYR